MFSGNKTLRVTLLAFLCSLGMTFSIWGGACAPPPLGESNEEKKDPKQESYKEANPNDAGRETVADTQVKDEPPAVDTPSTEPPVADDKPGDVPTTDVTPKENDPDTTTPEQGQEADPPEVIIRQQVLTPKAFQANKLVSSVWTLPTYFSTTTKLHMAIHANTTTVLGTNRGFFRVFNNGKANVIRRVDTRAVVGVASWKDTDVVVAHSKQLYLWDGSALSPTNFFKNLDGSNIRALAERDKNSFWIGTAKSLWLFDNNTLQQFKNVTDVASLTYSPKKKLLLIRNSKNEFSALQENAGKWNLRSFKGENVTLLDMTSFAGATVNFWGFDDKKTLLYRRINGSNAAWWLFRLKPDANDKTVETLKLTSMLFQKKVEHTWALTANIYYRLATGTAITLTKPTGFGTVKAAASTSDSAMWLSDGKKLAKIGSTAPPAVSYAKDIKPIVTANCISCHSSKSTRKQMPYFETLAQVKAQVDRMVIRMNAGTMPPGAKTVPNADIAKFTSWKTGGFKP